MEHLELDNNLHIFTFFNVVTRIFEAEHSNYFMSIVNFLYTSIELYDLFSFNLVCKSSYTLRCIVIVLLNFSAETHI